MERSGQLQLWRSLAGFTASERHGADTRIPWSGEDLQASSKSEVKTTEEPRLLHWHYLRQAERRQG